MFAVARVKAEPVRRRGAEPRAAEPARAGPDALRLAIGAVAAGTALRKCACSGGASCPRCEEEKRAQRKPDPSRPPGRAAPVWPRAVQPRLEVGPADDPLEREADAVSEHVMRMSDPGAGAARIDGRARDLVERACAACEEEVAQRRADGGDRSKDDADADPDPDLEGQLAGLGPGDPLHPRIRSHLEPRFGRDFAAVRVHTGGRAAASASSIHALAYTVGHRIVFNHGQYAPESASGMRLLAHELTHVVQQNAAPAVAPRPAAAAAPAPGVVQRKPFFFAPSVGKPPGSQVHADVLPLFLAKNDLFIEAPIPGANREDKDKGAKGRADFYAAKPRAPDNVSRTIGIQFNDVPKALYGSLVQWSGGKYTHDSKSAPRGDNSTPRAKKLDLGPLDIHIGELKPGFSSESFLGVGQVTHYKEGIAKTATEVETWLNANPGEDKPKGARWKPDPQTLTSLAIPPEITYPSGTRFPSVPLGLYEEAVFGIRTVLKDAGLRGRLFVYKDGTAGVWSYEWIPDNIPASTGSGLVNNLLDRLNNDVIPAITAGASPGPKPKLMPGAPPLNASPARPARPRALPVSAERSGSPVARRKGPPTAKKFDDAAWKRDKYGPWEKDAKAALGKDEEVGKARVAETVLEVQERSKHDLGIPASVKTAGKGLGKVQHWHRFGGLYGWLREKFDFLYVKFQKFADWVKAKVKKLAKPAAGLKFGNWIKAAAQAIFKIFKMIGSWAVTQVVTKLVDSFQRGFSANLQKLVDMATPEGVKSKIEEFEEKKAEYQAILDQTEEDLTKAIFGEHLELFEKLEKFEAAASTASTVVAVVEWGVRLLACASPPAIGCLWNLAISALQAALAILLQTCWFAKKVYEPVIRYVDLVGSFPAKVAGAVVKWLNEKITVPDGFDPLFAGIEVNSSEFAVDCDETSDSVGRLTKDRKAIMDLYDELGKEKFEAFLEMMSKRAASPWALVTAERLEAVKTGLKEVSADKLKELAADPAKGAPTSLETFLGDIAKQTEREKKVAKEHFEALAKAAAEKAAAGKGNDSSPSGTVSEGGAAPPGGGVPEGVTVLNGADHPIKGVVTSTRTPGIVARVIGYTAEHKSKPPATIGVDIFVGGTHRYRVNNVKVRGTFGGEFMATPKDFFLVVYYLEPGLELEIDGKRYVWEQLQVSWLVSG